MYARRRRPALRSKCGHVHCKTRVHSRPCIPALTHFFLSVFLRLSLTITSMVVSR